MKYYEDRMKARHACAHWSVIDKKYDYDDGVILCPEGVVEVMISRGENPSTRFDTIIDGYHVIRTYQKAYTKAGAARMARNLIREGE